MMKNLDPYLSHRHGLFVLDVVGEPLELFLQTFGALACRELQPLRFHLGRFDLGVAELCHLHDGAVHKHVLFLKSQIAFMNEGVKAIL